MSEPQKKVKTGRGPFDVTRKIPLASAIVEKLQAAAQRLATIESILDARVYQRGQLRIVYDASRVGMCDIERLLDELGVERASDFWSRLKLSWYRFLDENAKSNAASGGGACCNHPPATHTRNSDAGKRTR